MVVGGLVISRICVHSLLSLTHLCISSITFKVGILCFIFAYQFFICNLSLILYFGIVPVYMYAHMCVHGCICVCKLTGTCVMCACTYGVNGRSLP